MRCSFVARVRAHLRWRREKTPLNKWYRKKKKFLMRKVTKAAFKQVVWFCLLFVCFFFFENVLGSARIYAQKRKDV